jgi:hypothetical protein
MTATSGAIRAGRKVLAPAHGMDVAEVIGAKRDVLLARVEEFLAGKARPTASSSWATSATRIIEQCSWSRKAASWTQEPRLRHIE